MHPSIRHQASILTSGCALVFPGIEVLQQKLEAASAVGRPLTVKLGFDPTAPDLHLGHAVVLNKLRQFQDYGHRIVIVIGDFTARIGDPTGRNKARLPLNEEQVRRNARTYLDQVGKVLDTMRCEIRFNAEWLGAMNATDTIRLLSHYTLAQVMQRDDFSKRFREGTSIALHELMYPLLQGQDSVVIGADVEIGGTDQLFNCTVGRQLQQSMEQDAQVVLCMPLLKGVDGSAKMSKSANNTIGLTDAPEVQFGKVMSLPDDVLEEYLWLASGLDAATVEAELHALKGGMNPMLIKKQLGHAIVSRYHGEAAADAAQRFFEQQFQSRDRHDRRYTAISWEELGLPQNATLLDICALLKPEESRSGLRRLIDAGGVWVNDRRVENSGHLLTNNGGGIRLKIGKRLFFELL